MLLSLSIIGALLSGNANPGPTSMKIYVNDEYVQHIDYKYDMFGQLTESSNYCLNPDTREWNLVQSHDISILDRLIYSLRNNSIDLNYVYNQSGQLQSLTKQLSDNSQISYAYEYDSNGNQTSCTTSYSLNANTPVEIIGAYTTYYTYDNGRLISQITQNEDNIQYIEYIY